MKIRNVILGGLVATTLAAVLIHPHTHWVSRLQLGGAIPELLKDASATTGKQQRVAEQHPQDFRLQFGSAFRGARPSDLHALAARFPNEPALYAAQLRFETQGAVKPLHYADEDLASSKPGSKPRTEPKLDPAVLSAYDADAAKGEALAPDNAYFPFMRAVGLFGAGRDTEALAALHRAAQKPRYEDYVRDEAEARWALAAATYGNTGTIAQVAQSAAILFPHYAQLRSVARITLGKAIRAETAGDRATGLTLRQDLRKVGGLMRHDATTVIGNLVGIAIASISGGKPGGDVVAGLSEIKDEKARAAALAAAYEAYCGKIGNPEEGQAFRQEMTLGVQTKELNRRAMERELGVFDMNRLISLGALWLAGTIVLTSLLATLLFGGLLKGLSYTGRVRAAQPLHPGVAAGLWFALGSGLLGLIAVATMKVVPAVSAVCWFGSFAGTIAGFVRLFLGVPSGQHRVVFGAAVVTVLAAIGFGAFILLPALGVGQNWMSVTGLLQGVQGDGNNPVVAAQTLRVLGTLAGLALGVLLLPALATLALALWSWRKRVPASVGVVRGFPRVTLPLALLTSVLYAGLTWTTATRELQHQKELRELVQHEGRYNARLLGEAWPETPSAP